ncbi:hypothetical protein MKK69_21980 [Methylobacterium sp. J-026]|uniref:hypothetical protein n=1 Tax=Methylobacterium sp. J-026 TaxID=2836624 RepID=UPI001FB8D6AD|nr:hypothetical protein [Methylobacterium sp. J-026]MCJ2136684.1 hypothetical protein [Methylobacterium sp. J-026]
MATVERVNTTILGAAAEHYVMCQLLRRGLIAALAPAGVPDADIIVSNRLGSSLAAVQVKARINVGTGGWVLKAKHETIRRALLFYAFVDFDDAPAAAPRCWIVPSATVAEAITESHAAWLTTPGRNGQAHRDTEMRSFMHDYSRQGLGRSRGWLDPYREAWHLVAAASDGTVAQDPLA